MRKGFTLLELLIVIAILGVLASLTLVRLIGPEKSARDTRRKSDLRQYQESLEVYANRTNKYPASAATSNLSSLCATLGITACADDPQISGGWDSYKYQTDAGGLQYVLWTRLEKTGDVSQSEYFVLCSDGNAGNITGTVTVSGGGCPL